MARSLCGVPGLINGGSAHSRAGSETTEDQRSKHWLLRLKCTEYIVLTSGLHISLCRQGEYRPPDCDRCSTLSLVGCDCRVSPESVYIPRAAALTTDSKLSIVRMTVASHSHNGTIVTCDRVQIPLVTSTSAHVRSEISDRHGSAHGLWTVTRIVPRPGGARVRCGPTRRVGAESPMA
jgi:hypothetical protein